MISLIQDLDGKKKWQIYVEEIKKTLETGKSAIFLLPDINLCLRAQEIIASKVDCRSVILYRNKPQELADWLSIRERKVNVVFGTRSSIFAPLSDLGMIILDDEEDSVYKQDQVPHYHAREIALMRARQEGLKVILGARSPSLESVLLAKKKQIDYTFIPRDREFPQIKTVDLTPETRFSKKKNIIFSRFLHDAITSSLSAREKILLFSNRKGFATFASCQSCRTSLKCPRCNINLVYHFSRDLLSCHYCNFKMPLPKICPECNKGYIKFSGVGTERIESELARLFPQARIKQIDNERGWDTSDADIFVSTSSVIRHSGINFDLAAVLGIDNSLNRVDFRASEKTFALLVGILGITNKTLIIQTALADQPVFQALLKKDVQLFYNEELKQRSQLKLPPYRHLAQVRLRAKKENRVEEAAVALFKKLSECGSKDIEIISVNPGTPPKLRGNFYWQVLVKGNAPKKMTALLKKHLKDFSHSGIIVTVDMDPI